MKDLKVQVTPHRSARSRRTKVDRTEGRGRLSSGTEGMNVGPVGGIVIPVEDGDPTLPRGNVNVRPDQRGFREAKVKTNGYLGTHQTRVSEVVSTGI